MHDYETLCRMLHDQVGQQEMEIGRLEGKTAEQEIELELLRRRHRILQKENDRLCMIVGRKVARRNES